MSYADRAVMNEAAHINKVPSKVEYLREIIERANPETLAEELSDKVAVWQCSYKLEKRWGEDPDSEPYEIIDGNTNLLMYGGASCLWECLEGNGTGTGGQTLTYFDNSNAYIGVGADNTAAAATQTDLVATGANVVRVGMEATYPQHTDATTSGAATVTYRSLFGTASGNFAWQEWGIFNGSSGGRMLNRKVESLGTKTSAASWTFTVTLTLS